MRSNSKSSDYVSLSLGVVADWMHALNGNGDLSAALEKLMHLTKADSAVLVRTSQADKKSRYIARCDSDAGKVWHSPPRSRSQLVMGENLFSAKSGSVWKLSDGLTAGQGVLVGGGNSYDRSDGLCEVIVLALATETSHSDNLELHFRTNPAQHDLNLVFMLTETLASNWSRRAPGLITKRLNRKRLHAVSDGSNDETSILDTENPAQLSRCEFRVCTLLKEGMTVNLIAESLFVSQATVRSHLSSVFSKTGTSNQVELLFKLNGRTGSSTQRSA